MKLLAIISLAILSFVGVFAGILAATGQLSMDTVDQILGRGEAAEPAPAVEAPDEVDGLVRALRDREQTLAERAARLEEREQRLAATERELMELREEVENLLDQLTGALAEQEEDRERRLQEVADSLAGMRPGNAAEAVSELDPDIAARVLSLMDQRDRGKVLDEMEPRMAASLLSELQR